MPNPPSTTACLTAVQSYLEEEFPGCVEAARENVIGVSLDGICHHVVLQPTFLNTSLAKRFFTTVYFVPTFRRRDLNSISSSVFKPWYSVTKI